MWPATLKAIPSHSRLCLIFSLACMVRYGCLRAKQSYEQAPNGQAPVGYMYNDPATQESDLPPHEAHTVLRYDRVSE